MIVSAVSVENVAISTKANRWEIKIMEKPTDSEMVTLIGKGEFEVWEMLCAAIEHKYDMNIAWNKGGKAWKYECKYSKGGKTLCGLYARDNTAGFMIIFGGMERQKVEEIKNELSDKTVSFYDEAETYRDGKWVMFPLVEELIEDYMRLLTIKRKPNRD